MDPKDHQGIDWDAISAIISLIVYAIVFLAGLSFVGYVLYHFLTKYW